VMKNWTAMQVKRTMQPSLEADAALEYMSD